MEDNGDLFGTYIEAAQKGDPKAEYCVGVAYETGNGIQMSYPDAVEWYRRSVGKGYLDAMNNLGWMYQRGYGVGQSDSEAFRLFSVAAESGNQFAQDSLGWMYENGKGTLQSFEEAARWYQKAVDQHNSGAMAHLGWLYANGQGVPQSCEKAIDLFMRSSELGDSYGQYSIGCLYENGQGVERNHVEAMKWFMISAKQGEHVAIHEIGWLYENGLGVEQDYAKARQCYEVASSKGNSTSYNNLGWLYVHGYGVEQDYTKAVEMFKRSSELGEPSADDSLGWMYENGYGVAQDYAKAVEYYKRAADGGITHAMCDIGRMYECGYGVEQSDVKAGEWYRRAAEMGDDYAKEVLGTMPECESCSSPESSMLFTPAEDGSGIRFDDVIGLEKAKREAMDSIVIPMQNPELYERFKKKVGGGILLYGLPGTGKTMFAQAVANEVDAKFYQVKCSDVVSKWVGETEGNIKKLFKEARSHPRSIIFFDEFDAIGGRRGRDTGTYHDTLVAELLSQMQGFDRNDSTLFLIAASNRPWDIDSAMLRPGRFSKRIFVGLPNIPERLEMIRKQFEGVPVSDDVDLERISHETDGFSGADVVELCEQMKMSAIRRAYTTGDIEGSEITREDADCARSQVSSSVSQDDVRQLEEFEKKNGIRRGSDSGWSRMYQ